MSGLIVFCQVKSLKDVQPERECLLLMSLTEDAVMNGQSMFSLNT